MEKAEIIFQNSNHRITQRWAGGRMWYTFEVSAKDALDAQFWLRNKSFETSNNTNSQDSAITIPMEVFHDLLKGKGRPCSNAS